MASWMEQVRACPKWRDPVTLGGGKAITKLSSAPVLRKKPWSSHQQYHPRSTSPGLYVGASGSARSGKGCLCDIQSSRELWAYTEPCCVAEYKKNSDNSWTCLKVYISILQHKMHRRKCSFKNVYCLVPHFFFLPVRQLVLKTNT